MKFAILLFGAIMVAVSLAMIARPEAWGRAIVRFTRLPYMHSFEIVTRVGFGVAFVTYADYSRSPTVLRLVGYVLLAAGLALLFMTPSFHRRLALWSAEKLAPYFRPAGLASLVFGSFLIYAAI